MYYLPGPGYTHCVDFTTGEGVQYTVMGPVGSGLWLRDVEVFWSGDVNGTVTIGGAIGGSSEASAVAYTAGRPLVMRGNVAAAPHRGVRIYTEVASSGWFRLPLGLFAGTGARYLVFRMVATGANNQVSVVLALRTLRLVSEREAASVT